MSRFVKICSKCRHANPEFENICGRCGHFIGMETPVIAAPPSPPAPQPPAPESAVPAPPRRDAATLTAMPRPAVLYLQVLGTHQVFELRDGWTIGQAHASNNAELQLHDLPGLSYVHRQHCRFEHNGETWLVRAIDQKQHGREFTNPTRVNQVNVEAGHTHPLHNGDELTLAKLSFVVRILDDG
jgi:hypothetical protein